MRLILSIALGIALMSVGSASAQIVDMNTFTCNDFIGFKRDTALTIVMWLDAYYRDEDLRGEREKACGPAQPKRFYQN